MYQLSRVVLYVPEAEWNEVAAGLAYFATALEPTCNLEELFFFILDLFETGGGEITLTDLSTIATMAKFYKATIKPDFETSH